MWTSTSIFPKDRIRIYDRTGIAIAEFRTSVERSWVLADEGRAQFTYPSRKTQVVNPKVLNFGNWILIENNMMPEWIGVIDPPQEWDARNITVSAYSPEHVFGWRRGPVEETIKGSAGTIFANLISKINKAEATILQAGNIWRGGEQREETLNPTLLNEDLKRIQERSLEEYEFQANADKSGRLRVIGNWSQKIGKDTSVLLHEGKGGGNIEVVGRIMVVDGVIVNDLLGYGEGATWKSKPMYIAKDKQSIGKYGLRQGSENFTNATQTSIKPNTIKRLQEYHQLPNTFRINALNVGKTWSYIRMGNTFTLRLQNVGFGNATLGYETTIRIVGMLYDPANRNKIELTVVEVL